VTDSNRILVHRVGDPAPWSAPESSSYANEAHLQEVLAGFVKAVENLADSAEQEFANRLLALLDRNARAPRLGEKGPLAFEKRGVFFRAYGLKYPAI
jgi:hypothetical protein